MHMLTVGRQRCQRLSPKPLSNVGPRRAIQVVMLRYYIRKISNNGGFLAVAVVLRFL